jgi:outer membrane protein OmpA-like peptidoglycan-associated protein
MRATGRRTFAAAALGAGLALPLASAQAQMIPRTVELDGFASYYSFMSRGGFDEDKTVKLENLQDGGMGGGRFGIHFAEWIGFESTVGVLRTSTDDTLRRAWYVNAHFDAVLSLPFPYVVPYFAVGAGFQHYNIRPLYARGIGPANPDLYYRDPHPDPERLDPSHYITYRSADGDFLIDAGGGAKFLLFERIETEAGFALGLRLDIRWKLSVGPGDELDGVPTLETTGQLNSSGNASPGRFHGTFHHVELGGGVFVLFGGGIGPDRDKDGIPNRKDACIDDPEDKDQHEDEDGCPDMDNDGDGVPDEGDKCPNEAEDKDGWEDKDGCPDVDNDQDGILDVNDKCPTKPEDDDGFEDMDGCPEIDNDQDGYKDADDGCPTAPETWNSYLDDDGCPDEVPVDLAEFAGAIPAIQFQVDSAKLLKASFPILDKAARALMRYPDLAVEIQGHASSEGDDDYNMRLSQDRTETVREYLIGKGVDSDRLTARGYGETQPRANNDTEQGRDLNRRVEFKITRMRR